MKFEQAAMHVKILTDQRENSLKALKEQANSYMDVTPDELFCKIFSDIMDEKGVVSEDDLHAKVDSILTEFSNGAQVALLQLRNRIETINDVYHVAIENVMSKCDHLCPEHIVTATITNCLGCGKKIR